MEMLPIYFDFKSSTKFVFVLFAFNVSCATIEQQAKTPYVNRTQFWEIMADSSIMEVNVSLII